MGKKEPKPQLCLSEEEIKLRLHSVFSIGPAENLAEEIAYRLKERKFRSSQVLVDEIRNSIELFLEKQKFDASGRGLYLGLLWKAAKAIAKNLLWCKEIDDIEAKSKDT